MMNTGGFNGRPALTLIEVLVVIFVLGLMVAILVPAVQTVREASRAVNCRNNLKQIGLGLIAYGTANGSFPPAMGQSGAAFHVAILPYVEQTNAYNSINFAFDLTEISLTNKTACSSTISLYLCPSDSFGIPEASDYPWTNYAGCRGIGSQKFGENGSFAMPPGNVVSASDLTDGTSVTAMVSEWVLGSGPLDDRAPLRATFKTPHRLGAQNDFEAFANLCRHIDPATAEIIVQRKGFNWMRGDYGSTLYNHTLTPNSKSCLNGTGVQIGAWTASSRHPGGVNLLTADGSVHFVKETIQERSWWALGSRNGGEVVSSPEF